MFQRYDQFQLPIQTKAIIATYTEDGLTAGQIARKFDLNLSTVQRWVRRNRETGNVDRAAGSGRPRKTTALEDISIILASEENHFSTINDIKGKSCV